MSEHYANERELIADGWEIIGRELWKPGVVRLSSRKLSTVPAMFRQDYVTDPRATPPTGEQTALDELVSLLDEMHANVSPRPYKVAWRNANGVRVDDARGRRVAEFGSGNSCATKNSEAFVAFLESWPQIRTELRTLRASLAAARESVKRGSDLFQVLGDTLERIHDRRQVTAEQWVELYGKIAEYNSSKDRLRAASEGGRTANG